ncbi:MAG: hypothetical protein J2P24_15270 [Streptosporangiales bacterium]|nr:hypothetical protein [Streptosporangiales bacterium]MBO0889896.1 hypothetical protein [Acidothermales bacterium]
MRAWIRQFRRYLIAAPLVLAVGFGWNVWYAWHGNDSVAHRPVDVPKGKRVQLGPDTVQLAGLRVERPRKSSSFDTSTPPPRGAVVVVATFRARIDDVKGYSKFYCDSSVQNADGWIWPAMSGGVPDQYVPPQTPKACDGKTLNKDFKDVVPKPHTWYRFAYGYYVPGSRAHGLRPTLEFYKEDPHYLRFSS